MILMLSLSVSARRLSFVKGNLRYYDKCARMVRKIAMGSAQGIISAGLIHLPACLLLASLLSSLRVAKLPLQTQCPFSFQASVP